MRLLPTCFVNPFWMFKRSVMFWTQCFVLEWSCEWTVEQTLLWSCHWSTSCQTKRQILKLCQATSKKHVLCHNTVFVSFESIKSLQTWCVFVRPSLHIRREEKPIRCHWIVYCIYNMLNIFRVLFFMPIIRSSRLYVCYYRLWCAMPWLLVVGGQVQDSWLGVRDEGRYLPPSRATSVIPNA